jgi:hypothetical protein
VRIGSDPCDARRREGSQRDRRRHVGEHAVVEDEEVRRDLRHAQLLRCAGATIEARMM